MHVLGKIGRRHFKSIQVEHIAVVGRIARHAFELVRGAISSRGGRDSELSELRIYIN